MMEAGLVPLRQAVPRASATPVPRRLSASRRVQLADRGRRMTLATVSRLSGWSGFNAPSDRSHRGGRRCLTNPETGSAHWGV